MLPSLHLHERLRQALVKSGVTGEIRSHGAAVNLESIRRLMKRDPYITFGIKVVEEAVAKRRLTESEVVTLMAESLGTTAGRFRQAGPSYIAPQLTAARLNQMLELIDDMAPGGVFVLATGHPGSLMGYYCRLGAYIRKRGGCVYSAPEPVKVGEYLWIDQVDGVHVLSDMGGLLHTHESAGFATFLHQLPQQPDVVLADHGYAGAAINARIRTVALHDVDDVGIAVAGGMAPHLLAVPMNDNQLNAAAVRALEAILEERGAS